VAARALMQCRAQVAPRRGSDAEAGALRALRRIAALIAGSDIRYPMPGAIPDTPPHPLAGTFAANLILRTGQGATTVAELMHRARPVLLDLADRPDLRKAARGWQDRVDVIIAKADSPPADALLIRPDAYIAWAAATAEPGATAESARDAARRLRGALSHWSGPASPAA
jgi:hypothetical protein